MTPSQPATRKEEEEKGKVVEVLDSDTNQRMISRSSTDLNP